MSCRPPPSSLDPLYDTWPKGKVIHVIHDTAFAPESFNPGVDAYGKLRRPTRFAPVQDRLKQVVPYLYGGSTFACAIYETIFHDVPFIGKDKFVDLDDFAQRSYGQLIPQRDLKLVDLTSKGLRRLNVPKEELITSPSADYEDTALWAQALHHAFHDVDGLLWMSRQYDRDQSLMLFGDRVSGALSGLRMGLRLSEDNDLRQAIISSALEAGIVVN